MFAISAVAKGYLLKGLLVVLVAGGGWGGYELISAKISAKNTRITALESSITSKDAAYELLKTELGNKAKGETVTEGVKADVKQTEVTVEKAKTTANQYVDKKMAEIDVKYNKMEKTSINLERKRVDISLERAKGLWMAFCLQEPEEQACK